MKFAFANFFPLILRGYCKKYPFLINDTPHACGELTPHVHDGSARAGNSPRTRAYSFLRSARAENILGTCAMGARVPVTRPARARTLFCGAHAHVLIIKQVGDMYSDLDKLKSRVERRRIPISESSYFYSAYFSSSCV